MRKQENFNQEFPWVDSNFQRKTRSRAEE